MFAYSGDIDIISCVKNGLIEPSGSADKILGKAIGFEGVYYLLTRMKPACLLLEIMWNFLRKPSTKDGLFLFLAELVLNQLTEELLFVNETTLQILRKKPAERLIKEEGEEQWLLGFLQFYERLVWNDKKVQEIALVYKVVIEEAGIKFPAAFAAEPEDARILDNALIDYSEKLSRFKLESQKQSPQLKKAKSIGAFSKGCEDKGNSSSKVLTFSQKNVLNKLEQEVVQKRASREEVEVITEGNE